MKGVLTNMLWLPVDLVDMKKLEDTLTLGVTGYTGATTIIKPWHLNGHKTHIGVPRNLDERKVRKFCKEPLDVPIDLTSWKEMKWPKIKFPKGWDYWPGQQDSVWALVEEFTRGKHGALLEAPCGSGKTLMGLDVASKLNAKTLVMVHKDDLAKQWKETADNLFPDVKFGHIQQDKWDYEDCHVTTASTKTLYSRRNKLPDGFVNNFGFVIYDEGHRYPAITFAEVLRMFPVRHRLAVSATWRRKDKLDCLWNWHIGSLAWSTRAARMTGEYIQIPWNTSITDGMFKMSGGRSGSRVSMSKYITAISKNSAYNKWLANQLEQSYSAGRRTLCIGDRVEQLEWLEGYLRGLGLVTSVGLYIGRLKDKEREEAKTKKIMLATYGMMAEGTDVPNLDTLLFATPRSDVEQVVGRIMRHADKKSLLVVDPYFDTPFNERLAWKRKKIYHDLDFTECKK